MRDPTCRMWSSELRSGLGLELMRLYKVSPPLLRRKVIRHNMNAPRTASTEEATDAVSGVKKNALSRRDHNSKRDAILASGVKNISPKPHI